LAIGKFSIKNAVILQHIFLLFGLIVSLIFIPKIFFIVIIISILSYSYSILFKPIPLLNIIILVTILFCEIIIGFLLFDMKILQMLDIQNIILFLSLALSIVCWKQYFALNKLKKIKPTNTLITNYTITQKNIFLTIGIVFTFIVTTKIIVSIIN
jgi:4-hydroxybenzoate polyprenyltransferase